MTPGLSLSHQGQLVVAGKEVGAVSDLVTATDPQLFDKGEGVGGVRERKPGLSRFGIHDEEAFDARFDQWGVEALDPTGQQCLASNRVKRISLFNDQ